MLAALSFGGLIMQNCSVSGCEREAEKKGLCAMHYRRVQRGKPIGPANSTRILNARIPWLESMIGHKGDECVFWPFAYTNKYGKVDTKAVGNIPANRLMCILAHGEPPSKEHEAAHSCGVAGCLNPNHLSWKTVRANAQDRILHGTSGRGSKNPQAKLTEEQVIQIRERLKSGKRGVGRRLSEEYGVSPSQISMINRRDKWGWLQDT